MFPHPTKSEYLFDHPPEKYAHLQVPLAKMKIADANELIGKLLELTKLPPHEQKGFQEYLKGRIDEAIAAREFWRKILEDSGE